MHTHAEVYLESSDNWEKQVENILLPYDESLTIEEEVGEDGEIYDYNPNGLFDWYQIGGRWTGSHGRYNPAEDISNYETCKWCHGTGLRNDEVGIKARRENPDYKCNGCCTYGENGKMEAGYFGAGMALKWNTEWVNHESNIVAVEKIDDKLDCGTIFINNECWEFELWDEETKKWIPNPEFNGNVKDFLNKKGITTGFLVTVDYHW